MTRHLLAAIVAFSACAAALAQVPLRFSASIETFRGHAYAVGLHDGTLMYSDATPTSNPTPVAVTPTREQWREFRSALDDIGVWTWHESYMPTEPIFDGTSWSLSVRYEDRSLVTGGSNAYPDARAFRQFEAA